jgi:hypothetical protein
MDVGRVVCGVILVVDPSSGGGGDVACGGLAPLGKFLRHRLNLDANCEAALHTVKEYDDPNFDELCFFRRSMS